MQRTYCPNVDDTAETVCPAGRIPRQWLPLAACCGGIMVFLACFAGCSSKTSSPPKAVATPPESTEHDPSIDDQAAYPIPDGDASELLQFINKLAMQPPAGETDDEQTEDLARIMTARADAAEKILAESNDESLVPFAQRAKLESLRVLRNIGRERAGQAWQEYALQLVSSDNKESARIGRINVFLGTLDSLANDPDGDPGPVVEQLRQLLKNETKDHELYYSAEEAVNALTVFEKYQAAGEAAKAVAQAYADHDDPEIVARADRLGAQSKMADVETTFQQLDADVPDAETEFLTAVDSAVAAAPPSNALAMMMDMARHLESQSKLELAGELYDRLKSAVEQTDTPDEMTDAIGESLQLAELRLGLVGQPLKIVGSTSDGKKFDWTDLDGNVVLVNFWATWCIPCVEEFPNLRKIYDQFHPQGFDVVGINVDEDPSQLEEFLKLEKLPWVTLVSDEAGKPNQNALALGVETLPFTALVGHDGTVIAVGVQGDTLQTKLEEILLADSQNEDIEMVVELDEDPDDETSDETSDETFKETSEESADE